LCEDSLTKDYKTTVVIPKLFFSGKISPKLCDGTRLQVKHLRKNIIGATILTEYEKEKLYLFQNTTNIILS
jgi:hypothetical protein